MPDKQHLAYLGQPTEALIAAAGPPIAEYPYQGETLYLFSLDGDILTCSIKDGYIKAINATPDRRSAVRVTPSRSKRAILRHNGNHANATVIDLSTKAVALQLDADTTTMPSDGDTISFCTNLRTRAHTRAYVSFVGTAYKVDLAARRLVVLLHIPFETHSHRALTEYINSHRTQAALRTMPIKIRRHDNPEVTIIKSDVCIMCKEAACGLRATPPPTTGATHAS